jgi:maltooligosyltrehalose trehalohydrolase
MASALQNRLKTSSAIRRLPVGAEVQPRGGVHFRVWAPRCQRVSVQISRGEQTRSPLAMCAEHDGYFSVLDPEASAGDLYWYLLDDDPLRVPDPASRFQPQGPHGPSEIIDPAAYAWQDASWAGVRLPGQVIYELHIGTLTPEGTWQAAERELPELAKLGVTLLEVMPVAATPGRFNWGYDGVDLYAPMQTFGRPDAMRHFVDAAHQHGIGVILDVVYNHIGPDGNYLKRFSDDYFTGLHETDWGEAINFYCEGCGPVREFFIHNAGYWIDEFHLDGLRLDATQNIYDESADHVLAALTRHARARAGHRNIVVVAENEPQEARLVRSPAQGGYGIDGLWNDDFHHAALVALRGRNEAYYSDYLGRPEELLAAIKYGFIYQGQWSQWQSNRRGTPARDIPPWAFITFLENHDQVSNSLRGHRVHQLTSPGRYRAMTALLLLGPGTPMLFHGQEYGATTPYLFFADHHAELAPLVFKGRKEFLTQFPSIATEASQAVIDDPASEATFRKCILNLAQRQANEPAYRLHKDLLALRREEPALKPKDHRWYDGAALTEEAFLLRYFADREADERLLLVNLGTDRGLGLLPQPLLAAPRGMRWAVRWSSEDIAYGGCGTPVLTTDENWKLLGESALWLAPEPEEETQDGRARSSHAMGAKRRRP